MPSLNIGILIRSIGDLEIGDGDCRVKDSTGEDIRCPLGEEKVGKLQGSMSRASMQRGGEQVLMNRSILCWMNEQSILRIEHIETTDFLPFIYHVTL